MSDWNIAAKSQEERDKVNVDLAASGVAYKERLNIPVIAEQVAREGILQGALLVVDSSLTPVDGSLLICAMEGEYRIKRYRKYPRQHLEDLSTGKKEALPVDDDGYTGSNAVFGVITHVINDARSGEFDYRPVI
ncbi:DNA polymerase III subunit theta [Escherichia coli]